VPPSLPPQPPKLLDQVRTAVRLRHFSPRTGESYVGWVRRYILFHRKRHPSEMVQAEVVAFLTHLANVRGVSASTQNQALAAHVLNRGPLGVRLADRIALTSRWSTRGRGASGT
jgi:hypothetical protein